MGSETTNEGPGYFREQHDQDQSRIESNYMYIENRGGGSGDAGGGGGGGGNTTSISSGSSSSSSSCGSTSGGTPTTQHTWSNIAMTPSQITHSIISEINESPSMPRNSWTFPPHLYQRAYLDDHYNPGEPVAIHHHVITQNSNQAYKRYFQAGQSILL